MDTTAVSIRTIKTELDRLRARRQYLKRALTMLKNDELVDVTTDETALRMSVHSLHALITANDVFVERASKQLMDAVTAYEAITEATENNQRQELLESFSDELEVLIAEITEQRHNINDSIFSTREILGHFLEDRGAK